MKVEQNIARSPCLFIRFYFFLLSSSHCLSTSNTAVTFFFFSPSYNFGIWGVSVLLGTASSQWEYLWQWLSRLFFFLGSNVQYLMFLRIQNIYTLQISNIQPCITFCFAFVTRSVKHAYSPILPQPLFPNQQKTPQMPAEKWYCEPIIIFHRVPSISKWMGSYIFFYCFTVREMLSKKIVHRSRAPQQMHILGKNVYEIRFQLIYWNKRKHSFC